MDFNQHPKYKPTLRNRVRFLISYIKDWCSQSLEAVDHQVWSVASIQHIAYTIATIIKKREIHLIELIFGYFSLTQGFLMLFRSNIYTSSPSYHAMSFFPQIVWGIFGTIVGVVQIRGVISEDRTSRLIGSSLAISFWTGYFISFILVAFNTAAVNYFGFVLANIIIHLRVQLRRV